DIVDIATYDVGLGGLPGGATPTTTKVSALNLTSGSLAFPYTYALWTTGPDTSTWSGGTFGTQNVFENHGTLTVTGTPLFAGGSFDNVGLFQVQTGATFRRNSGAASYIVNANPDTGPAATFELQGTATFEDSAGLANAGLVLKTGSGTATFSGYLQDGS